MTYHQICSKSNTKGATSGAGITYHSGATELSPGFCGVRVEQYLFVCVVFCRALFFF